MKQSLQLKLGQQLTITPQLQQAIKLLQLSTLDLQQEIQQALETNPMLEVSEDESPSPTNEDSTPVDTEKHAQTHEEDTNSIDNIDNIDSVDAPIDGDWNERIPDELPVDTNWEEIYQSSTPASSSSPTPAESENSDYEARSDTSETLYDHLMWQLNLTPMSDIDHIIALTIIDAVAPSGMLTQSAEDIFSGLKESIEELELDEVVAVMHRIQQFDPLGVASQSLSECLLVQLNQVPVKSHVLETAKLVVKDHLTLLGSRDYKQLMRRTKLKESELRDVVQLIQRLNPRPGDQINAGNTEYVVPDVFVNKCEDRWTVRLNPDIAPRIRINTNYAGLVKRADSSNDNTFLRDNLQEARWFLKSLQSRNETLLKVASCIVEKQRGFLDYGAEAMKPLVLHDVAEEVGMHESTISRVTTQKYMHTPQGIFELKYFFSSHVSTDNGGECSSTAIRAIIKKLVVAENPRKPLSDNKITALLAQKGIKVARRTIAKYRESLGISASNERKQLV